MLVAFPAGLAFVRRLLVLLVFTIALVPQIVFAAGPHTLTIYISGAGTVSRNPDFANYPNGAVVTLTAHPSVGSLFSHWSGDLTGSANPANIEMTSSRTVYAHFAPIPQYTVTTSVSGQGTITLNPAGGTYPSNTVVTATATPAQGWAFANWTGDAEGNSNPLSINVDQNKSIIANFAELPAIVQPPANVTTNSGSTVTFSVEARGADPLTYAWYFEDVLIADATSPTLTLTNVASTNEGTYQVRITNAYGTASASATLILTGSGCDGPNVVNTASESALRAAIESGGYVRLCFNGTITLTQPLNITKNVSLDATARNITLDGNNATRLFNVSTNVTLALTNLTLANGTHRGEDHAEGGRPGFGGAIFNQGGTVILSDCTLTNNAAIGGNGLASDPPAPGGSASGGAIFNERGTVRITSSLISSNTAAGGDGSGLFVAAPAGDALGGAIASVGGTVSVQNSEITTNICRSLASGSPEARSTGGAFNLTNTIATVSNSTLRANMALGGGGTVLLAGPPARRPTLALGGAISTKGGSLRITHSELLNNAAIGGVAGVGQGASGYGGAIYSDGAVSIFFATVASNLAQGGSGKHGGAQAAGGAWLNSFNGVASESVFFGNVARGGEAMNATIPTSSGRAFSGAIHNDASLELTNCTFTLNLALSGTTNGFSQAPFAAGGAIYSTTNNYVQAVNVTFASNSAECLAATAPGETRGANLVNDSGTVTLRNTILAYPNGTNSNTHGPITDGGHNISSDASANFNSGTSFNFTDPRLEPLADNGGPTLTMALRSDSPAIDFGGTTSAPAIDQRGFPRPSGNGIDIGAYEWTQEAAPTLASSMNTAGDLQLTFQAAANTAYEIQSSTNLVDWSPLETIPASPNSATITRTFDPIGERTFYQVLVSDAD
jgi:hypothetical protein